MNIIFFCYFVAVFYLFIYFMLNVKNTLALLLMKTSLAYPCTPTFLVYLF